jgi:DUF3024 family protein
MALPPEAREPAIRAVQHFCDRRAPEEIRDALRLGYEVRGSTITIVEYRPPWDGAGEWSKDPVAQLRHHRGRWALFWQRHTRRWRRYDTWTSEDVDPLLDEINADRDGVFWP